ncbi:hypothetical protein TBLA_0C07090 [Henningerozyma blattae CBS 6284]|uniref:TOG domain-containing protein n=1 Tax=Henningerozyma blattae (strain ATCC 34711 / CBS 6284 / DSM 70876 / NBRC 10599 / NRRL Y-10934 / UCD 77-7) TaxID=1071380 RepID=I2H298_HENB6|nr:hypothetical protein TBLA_0C07090 [Tetrapisispora blattae CBS 6284]CCH60500.1 hypothetical protein TBLA_0C07090 [Tetrapisispora blattae CBS 6284]
MSALPDETNSTLSNILLGFASPDNNIRSDAENQLNNNWITKENIHILLIFLSEQAAYSTDETLSALSAVLFRKLALRAPPDSKTILISKNITELPQDILAQIRSTLLKGFIDYNKPNNLRHKLSDAIAECSQPDLPNWPELLQTLLQALKDENPNFRESSFRIFSIVPTLLINDLDITHILSIFESGFTDNIDNVKINSVIAFVGYFKSLSKSNWNQITPLLPSLLNSLPNFLNDSKDEALTSVFESLIELVELAPKLFKDLFDNMIQFLNIVIKNVNLDLETQTRTTALELLTSFAENAPQMCKSNSNFCDSIIMNTLLLMTEISIDDENSQEWSNSDDTDDLDDEEITYDHARQALDRVSLKLGGKYLAPTLFQYLQQMIVSSEWRQRFAALMALSSAAEGCRDVLIGEINKILDMVLPLINDPHPRVQYACCNVLGQISTDFAPLIQLTSHNKILPALISKLTPNSIDRVQTHAAAALVNFSEHSNKDILEPYLDELLTNLLTLLQRDKLYVQEQALTTIAFIAEAAEKKFIKYYDTLMPILLKVLNNNSIQSNTNINDPNSTMVDESRVLKGKCIECSTLIALAVGKEKFSEYSNDLIQLLINYQNQGIQDDDSLKPYLEHGWSRICRLLGTDFIQLLPIVLPSLIETAKASQDVSLIEEEEASNYQQYSEWDVVQIQGKHIAIHTSILDDKVTAMDLLQVYASVLGSNFGPYVKDILMDIALPSIDFYLHDGVRATGASFIPILLTCLIPTSSPSSLGNGNTNTNINAANNATNNNTTNNNNTNTPSISEEVLQLWTLSITKLINGIMVEPMPEITQIYHSSLMLCFQLLNYLQPSSEIMALFTKGIISNLTDIFRRIDDRKNLDDEYNEDVDEDYDEYADENLLDSINKSINMMFKISSINYLKDFQDLWPLISTFLQSNNSILIIFAFTAIADMIQYCGDSSAPFKDAFIPKLSSCLVSPDPTLRQASSYVLGICAQYAPNSFMELCLTSLDTLSQLTTIPDAKNEDNETATDNASAAMAKILTAYQSSNNLQSNFSNYVDMWFKTLPTLGDEETAAFNYKFLNHLIENNGFGNLDSNKISTIVKVVIEALHAKMITGKNAQAIVDSVKKILGTLPREEAMQMLQVFPPEIMQTMELWFA